MSVCSKISFQKIIIKPFFFVKTMMIKGLLNSTMLKQRVGISVGTKVSQLMTEM